MSKIIKKQIKRSIPWFLIMVLTVSMLIGTAFNYDLRITSLGNIIFTHPQAEANSDRASTTVVVLNAPPSFSTQAYEAFDTNGSTSTVPVNASSSISFVAVGDDPEDNDYFLLICANSAVPTAATGTTPPECNGGSANRFARSATTTDMTTATATYSVVSHTHPESVEWYAFLCDLAPANSDCSPYNQGSGYATGATSSSPFYVNHHPATTNVYTSVDNRDPGGTFTFQASTTDSDVLGGDDLLHLYICSTNSWATSTGCAATEFCHGTSTENPFCTWTDTAPTPHGNTTYYAFIKDWHELSGTTTWSNTYTIVDVSPSVGDVIVNGGNPITVNLRGATNVEVTASTTFTDQNECGDVIGATSTIKYATSSSDTYECTADNNSCYKIIAANCYMVCAGGGSATGYVTCSTSLEYYAIPSDIGYASNPYRVGEWRSLISVYDESFYPFGTSTDGVDLNTLEGLEITQMIIDYGILAANSDTGAVNASTTVINYGNSPLDVGLLVGDMTNASDSAYKILAPQQEFSVSSFVYGVGGTDGSSTTPGTADVYVTRPHGADITDNIYWGVGVPNVRSGPYTGSTTFMAMVDNNTEAEWW